MKSILVLAMFMVAPLDKKIETLAIRMSEEMLRQIGGLAHLEGVSASEFARVILEAHLKRKADEFRMLQSIFDGNEYKV